MRNYEIDREAKVTVVLTEGEAWAIYWALEEYADEHRKDDVASATALFDRITDDL